MKLSTKLKAAALGVGVGALMLMANGPANAGTTSVTDSCQGAGGSDTYDAVTYQSELQNPAPKNRSDSTDICSVSLTSLAGHAFTSGKTADALQATIVVKGSVNPPSSLSTYQGQQPFLGADYYVMYQDREKMIREDNKPYQVAHSQTVTGCNRLPTGRVLDQQLHAGDGSYNFIGIGVVNDGTRYNVSPQLGYYDPSPSGAFFFDDLQANPNMAGLFDVAIAPAGSNTQITVTVASVERTADTTCAGNSINASAAEYLKDYGQAGDHLDNVTGLTTLDEGVVLPVTVPTSVIPGFGDTKAVGGLIPFSDVTTVSGTGADAWTPGLAGGPDNLGDGPFCPTPTFGGTLPGNPLRYPGQYGQPCQIDDNGAAGVYVLPEFIPSGYNTTF